MADATITVSNAFNFFGLAATNKWGEHNWGAFNWGEGQNAMVKNVDKLIEDSSTWVSAITKEQAHLVSESLSLTEDLTSEDLTNGNWNYIFTKPTTQAENRSTATFTVITEQADSWTRVSATSTTWS